MPKRRPVRPGRVSAPLPDRMDGTPAGAYPWVVYVLTDSARERFSISMAKDAGARALRHRICGNLRQRTPLLVLTEAYADRHTAVARMLRLRAWNDAAIRQLIDRANPGWQDLS